VLSEKSRVKVGCFRERLSLVNTLPTRRPGSTPVLSVTGRRRDLEEDGRGGDKLMSEGEGED
jgi:hypothetical protein